MRWSRTSRARIGQFTQADGSDTAKLAKRSEIKVQGMSVSLVEATGNFGGGMGMPGAAPTAMSDAMLLGAIANGPKGAVFSSSPVRAPSSHAPGPHSTR